MGLSIFASIPVIFAKRMQSRTITFLNAVAIGILVFLLADIYGDVSVLTAGSSAYLTAPVEDAVFLAGVAGVFVLLYLIDQRPSALRSESAEGADPPPAGTVENPIRLALIIAIGIGLQNLTEGLVFGSAWSNEEIGLLAVIFLGFMLQNVTEGFPIVSPLLGGQARDLPLVSGFFLVGGLPTILGGAIGYFYNNSTLDVLFDAMAIGAILYVIIPMLKVALRPDATRALTYQRHRLVYFGVLAGVVLGFVVNAF